MKRNIGFRIQKGTQYQNTKKQRSEKNAPENPPADPPADPPANPPNNDEKDLLICQLRAENNLLKNNLLILQNQVFLLIQRVQYLENEWNKSQLAIFSLNLNHRIELENMKKMMQKTWSIRQGNHYTLAYEALVCALAREDVSTRKIGVVIKLCAEAMRVVLVGEVASKSSHNKFIRIGAVATDITSMEQMKETSGICIQKDDSTKNHRYGP